MDRGEGGVEGYKGIYGRGTARSGSRARSGLCLTLRAASRAVRTVRPGWPLLLEPGTIPRPDAPVFYFTLRSARAPRGAAPARASNSNPSGGAQWGGGIREGAAANEGGLSFPNPADGANPHA